MLLKRLVEFAEANDKMPPPFHTQVYVRYEIRLTRNGQLAYSEPIDLADEQNKYGRKVYAPYIQPTSGVKASLLTNNAEYTLGIGREKTAQARVQECHSAYLALLEECASATQSETIESVMAFLSTEPLKHLSLPDDFDAGGIIQFSVDGMKPTDERSVRQFWSKHNQPKGRSLQCIACGDEKPALKTLPGNIKGLAGVGGNPSGSALISANKAAFLSYGLEGSHTSPICIDCAESMTHALNYLLSRPEHRLYIGNVIYVFWTSDGHNDPWTTALSHPESDDVREYLRSLFSGRRRTGLDMTRFFGLALAASNARVVVRDWIDTTLLTTEKALLRWFSWQEIVGPEGQSPRPLGLYSLAAATVRDPKKDMTTQTVTALIQSAITGVPLPDRLLQQVVRRCQVEQQVTRQHATLIKLVLTSQQSNPEEDFMSQLQPDHSSTAYHCGRLLAVLESIQRSASDGKLNTTLIDRFYGTASSAPASVFGNLLRGAQPHLAKMRKNDRRKGAAYALEQEMMDVIDRIPAFPSTLVAKEQAIFALGYYHQRAHDRAQAQSHRRTTDVDDVQADDE